MGWASAWEAVSVRQVRTTRAGIQTQVVRMAGGDVFWKYLKGGFVSTYWTHHILP